MRVRKRSSIKKKADKEQLKATLISDLTAMKNNLSDADVEVAREEKDIGGNIVVSIQARTSTIRESLEELIDYIDTYIR